MADCLICRLVGQLVGWSAHVSVGCNETQYKCLQFQNSITRLGLLGAIFLGILVTIPNIRSSYGFGITSLLILVGVTFDIARQIQALLLSEIY